MSRLDAIHAAARVARRALTDQCTIQEAIERELDALHATDAAAPARTIAGLPLVRPFWHPAPPKPEHRDMVERVCVETGFADRVAGRQ